MKFLMTYEAKVKEPPTPEKMAKLGQFAQESAKAGILVMTGGLQRPTKGTRPRCRTATSRSTAHTPRPRSSSTASPSSR